MVPGLYVSANNLKLASKAVDTAYHRSLLPLKTSSHIGHGKVMV
jgi:hypothetical protein